MDVSTLISAAGPDEVAAALPAVLSAGLDDRCRQRPPDRDWMLHPLHRSPTRSVVVAVFRPGAAAPIHDHGTWAVIGIYQGREQETWFRHGDLDEERTFVNATGEVSIVPPGVIHTVRALGDQDAISLHAYGTDIVTQERSMYDPVTHRASPYQPF